MGFHNPYNFVRTPDRSEIPAGSFAGDYDPSQPDRHEDFSRYWPERYTGVIPVRLTTVTPVFITNPEKKVELGVDSGHYVYDCLEEIPATALKGMLSSAYEIITNSRYRVFSERQHDKRLGYRLEANASLVPGRVEENGGHLFVTLFTGSSAIAVKPKPLYAAWLPTYQEENGQVNLVHSLTHGKLYTDVRLGKYSYSKPTATGGTIEFDFWSVEEIDGQPPLRVVTPHATRLDGPNDTVVANGYVVISGKIAEGKHDERFFFNAPDAPNQPRHPLPIPPSVRKNYKELLEDYQRTHKPVNGIHTNLPTDDDVELGEHIREEARKDLKAGDLVYVKTPDGTTIQAIYPVQISRELNDVSPWKCLDDTLKSAKEMSDLSPADRLFGWIPQRGRGAWRGKIRITCDPYDSNENADQKLVETFDTPLPLSILGSPKPAQARFYLGKRDATPQDDGQSKQDVSYISRKRLRGRKVYLHHKLSHLDDEERGNYWNVAMAAQNNPRTEYSRFPGQNPRRQSNQNRSITGWIPIGRSLTFKLHVENLTEGELGGLLNLLMLNQEQGGACYFRLGFGKPLGFGSVVLSIMWDHQGQEKSIPIVKGKQMIERYERLGNVSPLGLTEREVEKIILSYQSAMVQVYRTNAADALMTPDLEPWIHHRFVEDLGPEHIAQFREAWQRALDTGQDNAPLDKIPEREIVLDLNPNLEQELTEMYQDTVQAKQKFARAIRRGFGRITFIDELKKSMRGFDDPVVYPRRGFLNMDEGFKWFVKNEEIRDGALVTGYSLPEIGTPLNW